MKNQACHIQNVVELPCKSQPPPIYEGVGAERNYGSDITTYRCPNGYMWGTGKLFYQTCIFACMYILYLKEYVKLLVYSR